MAENRPFDPEQKARRAEYTARLNRVIDYVEENLAGDLSLGVLARVACFSPFHFHRLFHALMGETSRQYTTRLRVEKAATLLVHNPRRSITEIALDCGFSGSDAFARTFRGVFGMSASEWRAGGHQRDRAVPAEDSKNGQPSRKIRQDVAVTSPYVDPRTDEMTWRMTMADNTTTEVRVREMPERTVAYVRHIGPYKGDAQLFAGLFGKLMQWAGPRGLLGRPGTECLSVYHDDPSVTEEEKLRVSVCVTVPDDTAVEGEIGKMTVPGGRYAVGRFELSPEDYEEAWNALYGGWLPQSGYQPDARPALELYLNNPDEHPEKKHIVDICIPVRLL